MPQVRARPAPGIVPWWMSAAWTLQFFAERRRAPSARSTLKDEAALGRWLQRCERDLDTLTGVRAELARQLVACGYALRSNIRETQGAGFNRAALAGVWPHVRLAGAAVFGRDVVGAGRAQCDPAGGRPARAVLAHTYAVGSGGPRACGRDIQASAAHSGGERSARRRWIGRGCGCDEQAGGRPAADSKPDGGSSRHGQASDPHRFHHAHRFCSTRWHPPVPEGRGFLRRSGAALSRP
jgi:hypothetical protein